MTVEDDIVDRMFERVRARVSAQLAERLNHIIRDRIGEFLAQVTIVVEEEIRHEFGGDEAYIARASWRSIAERDAKIRAEASAGMTIRDIARRHCIGVATVDRILKRLPVDDV